MVTKQKRDTVPKTTANAGHLLQSSKYWIMRMTNLQLMHPPFFRAPSFNKTHPLSSLSRISKYVIKKYDHIMITPLQNQKHKIRLTYRYKLKYLHHLQHLIQIHLGKGVTTGILRKCFWNHPFIGCQVALQKAWTETLQLIEGFSRIAAKSKSLLVETSLVETWTFHSCVGKLSHKTWTLFVVCKMLEVTLLYNIYIYIYDVFGGISAQGLRFVSGACSILG